MASGLGTPAADAEVGGGATTSDRSVGESVVVAFAWTVAVAGLVWGTIYLALGLVAASVYPFAFSVISAVNAVAYRRLRRYKVFACVELFALLLLPAGVTLQLGGFVASGAVALWSLLAAIGALLVMGSRFAVWVFAAFVASVGVGLWADDAIVPAEALTSGWRDAFLLLNVTGVSLVAFWTLRTFLVANERLAAEQNRLRAIERSYVAQEAMLRQQERLATLGKLSAGIAHELNNPAAAAGRAALHLDDVVNRLVGDGIALLRLGIGAEGLDWVWSMVDPEASTDAIEVSDREERLARWFSARSAEDGWELASDLATLGFDVPVLDQAAERYNERQILAVMRWIAGVSRARRLVSEVRTSAGRISAIVRALKGYSHMDGAASAAVELASGIEDTLMILKSRLDGIDVEMQLDPELPRVPGNPGELNQVWTNLIANAAEALDGEGRIVIRGFRENGSVRVEVEDDGPGIPAALIDAIFDPFVTTKPPGEGTGLGLNITHQIVVDRHHGSITVQSEPGRTVFAVTLPVEVTPDA